MLVGRPLPRMCCNCSKRITAHRIPTNWHGSRNIYRTVFEVRNKLQLVRGLSADAGNAGFGKSKTISSFEQSRNDENPILPERPQIILPSEFVTEVDYNGLDESLDADDDSQSPLKTWYRATDEEVLYELDKRQRARARLRPGRVQNSAPSKSMLEDASRLLLHELLEKEMKSKGRYKKGEALESESDIDLLQRALNISVNRIQTGAKPGYHPLPFYLHRNSKRLDTSLMRILRKNEPDLVNKVCYNLLVSESAPTLFTFNILLRRFTKLRLTGLAHAIITTLFAVGFEPNAHTYAAILQYLTVTQNYEAFGKAVSIMRESFMDYRNPMLASAEMNGWSKFGDITSMKRRLKLLEGEGLRNDLFILTIQLRYYAKRAMWKGGFQVLQALLEKDSDDIDHHALFWAWKLCVKCDQHEFGERLRKVVQDKRLPVEILWTRPRRTKGLKYGFKGKLEGQVQPQGETKAPKWLEHMKKTECSTEDALTDGSEVKPPNITARAAIPRSWKEYSSVFKRVLIDGEDIIEESRGNSILRKRDDDLLCKGNPGNKPELIEDRDNTAGSVENDPFKSESIKPQPSRNFKTHPESSMWNLLVRKRKEELLKSPKKQP